MRIKEFCEVILVLRLRENGKKLLISITIETNIRVVKFLNNTFHLMSNTYKPYRKPNDEPLYTNKRVILKRVITPSHLHSSPLIPPTQNITPPTPTHQHTPKKNVHPPPLNQNIPPLTHILL